MTKNASSPFVNNTETPSLNATNIVINEVELNPQGSDADHEWIELYNPTNVEVNVSDFEIRTSFKSATISAAFRGGDRGQRNVRGRVELEG